MKLDMAAAVHSPLNPVAMTTTTTTELPQICSNEGPHISPTGVDWLRPSDPDTPLDELRRRFREDGYVWIKHLLPREDVLDMREAYFRPFGTEEIDLLKPDTSAREGIFNEAQNPLAHGGIGGAFPPEQREVELLTAAHRSPEYLKFLEHPALRDFIRKFTGWSQEVIVKRTMLRHNVPHGSSTGIHYDKIFLRAGEADFLTAWVPIGDCAAAGGGLLYLEKSSSLGREIEADFTERARDFTDEEKINAFNAHMERTGSFAQDAELFAQQMEERNSGAADDKNSSRRPRWLVADYEAGDVVFHDPYMIHGAVKNEDDRGRIRLSCDLRFYEKGAAADERWMNAHWTPDDGL